MINRRGYNMHINESIIKATISFIKLSERFDVPLMSNNLLSRFF